MTRDPELVAMSHSFPISPFFIPILSTRALGDLRLTRLPRGGATMSLSKQEALEYCHRIESRSGSSKARWGYLTPLILPCIYGMFGLKTFKDQPVVRNTVFAGLSGGVIIYGIVTKVAGPPGARGYTGALGT